MEVNFKLRIEFEPLFRHIVALHRESCGDSGRREGGSHTRIAAHRFVICMLVKVDLHFFVSTEWLDAATSLFFDIT